MKKQATVHRMVASDHLCPWGIKTVDLLRRNGFEVDDHHLESEQAAEEFKKQHDVDETPQVWIDGEHVGGYDALRERFGLSPDPKEGETYQSVVAVFAVTFAMALTACWSLRGGLEVIRVLELFITFSMCVLGILKLQDLRSFATGFVQYDVIARR